MGTDSDTRLDCGGQGWLPIAKAPRNGTEFQARIPGHGEDNVIAWVDGLMDCNNEYCGTWAFTRDQEPPDCWTDGYCWTVNEDGNQSVQPTHWMPLPPLPLDPSLSNKDEGGAS